MCKQKKKHPGEPACSTAGSVEQAGSKQTEQFQNNFNFKTISIAKQFKFKLQNNFKTNFNKKLQISEKQSENIWISGEYLDFPEIPA